MSSSLLDDGKLVINKTVIRTLTQEEITHIAGGANPPTSTVQACVTPPATAECGTQACYTNNCPTLAGCVTLSDGC